ncbi:histone H1t [Cynocephalus volans]|uniref:histone H1t n=1 Tax=Cynocephalus volans TaxID=110931 RepID=UPI002FCC4FC9
MSETAPEALANPVPTITMEKFPVKKRGKKLVDLTGASRKAPRAPVSKLIIEALSMSEERVGMSLVALKKALVAAGYDVEKNNSRIKLGLKSLVSKGVLVQTRGTGASGSFKLSKKVSLAPTKGKVRKPGSAKTKKLVLPRGSKSPKSGKTKKRAGKSRAPAAKKAARSGRKTKGANTRQQRKSPVKARAGKPKAGKPKLTQQKTNPKKRSTKK